MKAGEMKIRETVLIHEMGGKTHKLLLEKDIVKFLRSFKKCRFCGRGNLEKDESYGHISLTCKDCGFQLTSSHLYHNAEIEEGMTTIARVVFRIVEEAIKKHKQELMRKLAVVSIRRRQLEDALAAHFAL